MELLVGNPMAVGKLFLIILGKTNVAQGYRFIMSFIGAAFALYIVLIAAMYFGQRKLMYSPGVTMGVPVFHGIPEVVPIKLSSSDDLALTSWFRAPGTNKPIIIYFHGNAGHIGDRGVKVRKYVEAGYGILLVGYRGYGGNSGSPTEHGLYDDATAALNFLIRTGISPDQWVLYGESLGAAVAVEMAARFGEKSPVAAVVLEAPFTSMVDAAKSHYPFAPVGMLVLDRYDSISKINKINSPLLVVHGEADLTVPQKLGVRLFEAAHEPKTAFWIKNAGHSNLYDFDADERVMEFIETN